MKKPLTILIADDHEIIRTGLANVIEYEDDLSVVGVAKNGQTAIEIAEARKPDLVIMDLVMPGIDGIEATERIRAINPASRILILTSYATPADLHRVREAGAQGILLKTSRNHEILAAIRQVGAGETVIPPDVAQLLGETVEIPHLTDRQKEILCSLTRGLSNPDIARQLGISRSYVKKQLADIFVKLGAATRTEAASIALKNHLFKF